MFYKTFPVRTDEKLTWQEIYLTKKDELLAEQEAAFANQELMKECLDHAKNILSAKSYKLIQSNIVNLAMQLFAKRAEHSVFFKEKKCREIFNRTSKQNN
ncbi:hypothetical protein JXM83_02850 [Candidatus Woesearchaeota archaeon]|nr:hypothetical protein [Candidatus Woesearchaeota archaeon]